MSTEYSPQQLSDIKIQHMIDNAVKMGFNKEELDDLEQRAFECPVRRKKNRPQKRAVFVGENI